MLKKIHLENYKSHKSYTAYFNGNSIIEGNKGSGKTSLKDAFTWLMTGRLVDDPTPVDENGVVINKLTIVAECEFTDGTTLRIESKQKWVKERLESKHSATYFINGTPCLLKDYNAYLEKNFGTLEQRRIMLDPSWFAYGNGLATSGKPAKTDTQRRREIVIGVAGAADLEEAIAENEEKAKQSKYAISQLKKDLDEANAGIESLYNSKIDVSHLDKQALENTLNELDEEQSNIVKAIQSADNEDDTQRSLQQALNNAQLELSNAQAKYSLSYNEQLESAQAPYKVYLDKKQFLENELQQIQFKNKQIVENEKSLLKDIQGLEEARANALKEYNEIKAQVYSPDSITCQCCGQVLPQDKLREHEARFNKQRSDKLENITKYGKDIAQDLTHIKKQLELLERKQDTTKLETELATLVAPEVVTPLRFEETEEYVKLKDAVTKAQTALDNNSSDDVIEIYQRSLDNVKEKKREVQLLLNQYETNNHLDKQIELKGEELQGIAEKLDEQQDILDKCDEFIRETLKKLETTLEQKFPGIKFKMFDYTLDGTQKDTCITYAKTDVGYIPWENLSGGQKRSATIALANAFAKAWNVHIPLWIDDTQIYSEDELKVEMQLIRITEVPHKELVVK